MCMTVCVCVTEEEREGEENEGENARVFFFHACQQQWSGCFLAVIGRAQEMYHDVDSHT